MSDYASAQIANTSSPPGAPANLAVSTGSSSLTLTVNVVKGLGSGGSGDGTVTSQPAGINCGSGCSAKFSGGVQVSLSATPAAGSVFAGWSGAGCSNGVVMMDQNKSCTATFQPAAQKPATPSVGTAIPPGLLKVSTSNPRYFADSGGKTVLLAGHAGCPFLAQDGWGMTPPEAGRILAANQNLCRSWVWENSRWSNGQTGNAFDVNGLIGPMPFKRTGPGLALDGAPRFDLTQFESTFFDRLRSGVIEAGRNGLYVDIMLFQGWSAYKQGDSTAWFGHYFNGKNNINGIDGDPNGDGDGSEVFTLANPALTNIQDNYVRKMIDTLGDLDNVIWEIANEAPPFSTEWQYHMIDLIRSYEAAKPKQHPIGITAYGPDNSALQASTADWMAPGALSWDNAADPYISNPPVADGSKVIISDVDHLGFSAFENNDLALQWIWKTFTRGYNLLYQEMTAAVGDSSGSVLTYANKMKLEQMTPRSELSSTGYILANPGVEYLVYQPNPGESFTVDLTGGSYDYEWFDPATAAVVESGTITPSSGQATFRPPVRGGAVLYLKNSGAAGASSISSGASQSTLR